MIFVDISCILLVVVLPYRLFHHLTTVARLGHGNQHPGRYGFPSLTFPQHGGEFTCHLQMRDVHGGPSMGSWTPRQERSFGAPDELTAVAVDANVFGGGLGAV